MKTQHFFYSLLVLAICFTACKKDKEGPEIPTPVAVTGVTLNYEELTLVSGDTITLIATVKPDDADNKSVIWTSGNPEVATVNDNGFVTALSEGIATIVVTAVDGNISANCKVKVSRHEISVTDITLNHEALTLAPKDTITLIATVQPDDADNKNVTWTSSNPAMATVNNDGLVTAIANGEAIITASTQDGSKKTTCIVNVDYRNKWIGDWDFTTIDYNQYCYYEDSLVIIQNTDTIYFIGTIEKCGTDKLKIIFKSKATEPNLGAYYWPIKVNGLIYPVVDISGYLTYPEFLYMFSGSFSDSKINITYSGHSSPGLCAYESHRIQGIKINK